MWMVVCPYGCKGGFRNGFNTQRVGNPEAWLLGRFQQTESGNAGAVFQTKRKRLKYFDKHIESDFWKEISERMRMTRRKF